MAVSPRISEGSAKTTTKEIREWAIGEGRAVSPRGRISAEIVQAFLDAQAAKAQAIAVPAKKAAAKKIVAGKAPTKKTAAKKTAAKKSSAKTTGPRKTAAKEASAGKLPATTAGAESTAAEKIVAAKVPVVSKAPAKVATKEIREWAIGEGREVSPRGRISAEIVQAFHDAQVMKAQANAVPAKKAAAKKIVAG
ncbi:Lsr2 family DNA-binding protein, partial [Rhodococcus koreensis]